ncbi:cytochrome o ubiquinol oxidase subunit IV [Xylophilus ampelinus]|uniref:Cytochrome bo(3) ubiquinol oxidase subunit 4 n=1 Tax=Xylophilus ampelinus TaxID=54067 RepID=A0A318SFE3_9BURK|nr:cytochrome o ubiquinol oxidase subunit IV [Xylophilus ampelinus]MCS4510960.1 cytochrome o ubiquinol oxidase subunit IV [Xylophilus ampelinus]PYE76125.1 cytochrome bo3 quinol oxidase subunit 4 [Xylophilus ampelinus]
MSAHDNTKPAHGMHDAHAGRHGHDAHDGDHGHDHEDDGAAHSTLKGYVTGFILSVILTAIPFWLVMGNVFEKSSTTALVILGFAAVQIVVHMVYFLHMNTKSEGGWNMLALIFTLVVVVITLSGSLWVMFHMNANMMPMSAHEMKNMP